MLPPGISPQHGGIAERHWKLSNANSTYGATRQDRGPSLEFAKSEIFLLHDALGNGLEPLQRICMAFSFDSSTISSILASSVMFNLIGWEISEDSSTLSSFERVGISMVYEMSFELITLRFYHGGELNMGKVKGKKGKRYKGGQVTKFLDVDVDWLSLFEFRDYVRSDKDTLDISNKMGNGQVLEDFVCHMVGEPEVAPLLEFVSDGKRHVEGESGVSFNKDTENDIGSVDRASKNSEDAPPFDQPVVHTSSSLTVQPTSHTSPSFIQPFDHISSLPTDQPNAYVSSSPTDQSTTHVSSPIAVAPSSCTDAPSSSIVAPTNSTTAPFESIIDSDVESIDEGVQIGSVVDEYMDKELGGFREEKRKKKRGERPVIPEILS
ncbi:hypothetical protein FXO38_18749 [Capsicum annuum]|nr:hypothetical protein FXO38_18749 [Capsicum annuum]KAF3650114.1 hypothetical protein FXO37_18617 [Capsicum annuum]